jgi:hypothetical protein
VSFRPNKARAAGFPPPRAEGDPFASDIVALSDDSRRIMRLWTNDRHRGCEMKLGAARARTIVTRRGDDVPLQ